MFIINGGVDYERGRTFYEVAREREICEMVIILIRGGFRRRLKGTHGISQGFIMEFWGRFAHDTQEPHYFAFDFADGE